jgi:prepilin-type N-terminal cleavage/methylation domain-containing protein
MLYKRALDEKRVHLTALFFICAYFFVSRVYLLQQVSIHIDDGWHLMFLTISFFISNATHKLYKICENLTNLTNTGFNNMINNKKQNQAGFTLVELSIVLVIIGLIVSGVLAGQALIQQAKLRSQIRQIEELNLALGAFQGKFNFLPGDLPNPTRFFSTITGVTANGNGLISGAVNSGTTEAGVAIWQLYLSKLVQEKADAAAGTVRSKLDNGLGIVLNSSTSTNNYFFFGHRASVNASGNFVVATNAFTLGAGLTGVESYALDSKLDDGAPATGNVLSLTTNAPTLALVAGAVNGCSSATAYFADEVTTSTATGGNFKNCRLAVKTTF